ncbi:MAG: hypothetical protein FWD59_02550 [Micrococcales bacterium]|nr:hypothetical protein [Micrococcales bacterium]
MDAHTSQPHSAEPTDPEPPPPPDPLRDRIATADPVDALLCTPYTTWYERNFEPLLTEERFLEEIFAEPQDSDRNEMQKRKDVFRHDEPKRITLCLGVRGSGKTTFLRRSISEEGYNAAVLDMTQGPTGNHLQIALLEVWTKLITDDYDQGLNFVRRIPELIWNGVEHLVDKDRCDRGLAALLEMVESMNAPNRHEHHKLSKWTDASADLSSRNLLLLICVYHIWKAVPDLDQGCSAQLSVDPFPLVYLVLDNLDALMPSANPSTDPRLVLQDQELKSFMRDLVDLFGLVNTLSRRRFPNPDTNLAWKAIRFIIAVRKPTKEALMTDLDEALERQTREVDVTRVYPIPEIVTHRAEWLARHPTTRDSRPGQIAKALASVFEHDGIGLRIRQMFSFNTRTAIEFLSDALASEHDRELLSRLQAPSAATYPGTATRSLANGLVLNRIWRQFWDKRYFENGLIAGQPLSKSFAISSIPSHLVLMSLRSSSPHLTFNTLDLPPPNGTTLTELNSMLGPLVATRDLPGILWELWDRTSTDPRKRWARLVEFSGFTFRNLETLRQACSEKPDDVRVSITSAGAQYLERMLVDHEAVALWPTMGKSAALADHWSEPDRLQEVIDHLRLVFDYASSLAWSESQFECDTLAPALRVDPKDLHSTHFWLRPGNASLPYWGRLISHHLSYVDKARLAWITRAQAAGFEVAPINEAFLALEHDHLDLHTAIRATRPTSERSPFYDRLFRRLARCAALITCSEYQDTVTPLELSVGRVLDGDDPAGVSSSPNVRDKHELKNWQSHCNRMYGGLLAARQKSAMALPPIGGRPRRGTP